MCRIYILLTIINSIGKYDVRVSIYAYNGMDLSMENEYLVCYKVSILGTYIICKILVRKQSQL